MYGFVPVIGPPDAARHHELYDEIRAGRVRVSFAGRYASPASHRFWACVDKDGPLHPVLKTKCWDWTGCKGRRGYGLISVAGRHERSHRLSWSLHNGTIPPGLWVLHKCDRPACVNPEHLFLGNHAENMADMMAKARNVISRGERHGRAKLTEAQVMGIRARYEKGSPVNGATALGREFGVDHTTIRDIGRGKHWTHLLPAPYARDGRQLLLFPDY
jgi:hypothetical protein